MTKEQFDIIFKDTLKTISSTLLKKRQEYSPENFTEDVLRNFKLGASMLGTPELCLCSYLLKHLVSIFDMSKNPMAYDTAVWNEKIVDSINYLFLLKALILEEKEKQAQQETNNSENNGVK